MATVECPLCDARYLDTVAMCVDCKVALEREDEEDPRHLEEADQVVYELGDWSLDQRTAVAEVMAAALIPHAWDGDELLIHARYEDAVDALLEPIDTEQPANWDPNEGETEYDLATWPVEQRQQLVARLVEAGVPHKWEDTMLVVPGSEEAVLDDMFDDLEAGGDAAALEDDGNETPFEALEGLFIAADCLSSDAGSAEGRHALVAAMSHVDDERPPFGMDILMWNRAIELADELVDELAGEELDPDVISDAATELRRLLRPYI